MSEYKRNMYFCEICVAQSVQRLGYGLDDRGSTPGRLKNGIFFLLHRVQTGSVVNPASFSVGKTAGGVKLTSHLRLAPKLRMRGTTSPFTHISSWRSA
jgi:hypothetical protein